MENQVIETIMKRRSCRTFDPDRMPTDDLLSQVAEAGTWSPTSRGQQNPIIVVVTNRQLRDHIAQMNAHIMGADSDPFYGAPAILVVLFDKSCFTGIYDGSLVMGNMMLAAHSLGVDSIWIHRAKEEFESEEGKALLKSLGLEGDWEGVGHCALGYAAEPLPAGAPRKPGRIVWA